MKTIIDAVNNFQGSWRKGERFLHYREDVMHWYFGDNRAMRIFHGDYYLVCSMDQFNQCVDVLTGDPLKLIIWKESQNINLKVKPVTSPIYAPTLEDANKLIKKLGDAANNITTLHLYEDCYDIASEMLDLVTEYETPPIELDVGECYQFASPSGIIRKGYYIIERDLFICIDGNIDANRCTNIKLLEVKA